MFIFKYTHMHMHKNELDRVKLGVWRENLLRNREPGEEWGCRRKEKRKYYMKEYLNSKFEKINIKYKVINYLTLLYVIKILPLSSHKLYKLIKKLPRLTNILIWIVLNKVQETTWSITSDNRFPANSRSLEEEWRFVKP